jgi:hypothetical protein
MFPISLKIPLNKDALVDALVDALEYPVSLNKSWTDSSKNIVIVRVGVEQALEQMICSGSLYKEVYLSI